MSDLKCGDRIRAQRHYIGFRMCEDWIDFYDPKTDAEVGLRMSVSSVGLR
jgi:hypothetical protein